jgi:chromosome segregation ATPase
MNQYEWKRQARRLVDSQEKFVTTVYMLFDVFEAQRAAVKAFNEALEAREAAYDAGKRHIDAQMELIDQLLGAFKGAEEAYLQVHRTVHENNERMEKLLAKMEAYFGTTGLDYDN